MNHHDTAMIIFQPSGRRGRIPLGISIVEAARKLGADLETPCGEAQQCGKCRVRIESGTFEKYGITSRVSHGGDRHEVEAEYINEVERKNGYRLGCTARVTGDMLIYIPESGRRGKQVVSKPYRNIDIPLNPAVKCYHVTLSRPDLHDKTIGDADRMCEMLEATYGLSDLIPDLSVLTVLPDALRDGGWKATVSVWKGKRIIRVRSGHVSSGYGLAIDVGTTTVAGYLCRLDTGKVVSTASMMNPQCRFGEDVMSRISYHMNNDDGLSRMQKALITGLNELAHTAVSRLDPPASVSDIEDVAICCNTAMHHILLGLDPRYLGVLPFSPVIQKGVDIKARELGFHLHPGTRLYVLPNEAGFVGADNVAVLLAEKPYDQDNIQLIIDIGTNGEIVLGNRKRLFCASCATGPALEGAQIRHGMRAAPGAIERVKIDPDTHAVDYRVIGRDAWRSAVKDEKMNARGICGSGILDVTARMLLSGILKPDGAFNPAGQKSDRLRKNASTGKLEFVLARSEETAIGEDVVVTQADIRQVQLAKAAVYTGCKILMKKMGVDKVDAIKIAGAFGTHVDKFLALTIGLVPDTNPDLIESVGNAAGDGCRIALLNHAARCEAEKIARKVHYVELSLDPEFQDELVAAIHLPHQKDPFVELDAYIKS